MSTASPRSLKKLLGEPAGSREENLDLEDSIIRRPEIGEKLQSDLQGTGLVALYGLSIMARKLMFLRLGMGTGYPQTLKQTAQTLSLTKDEALTLEDEALLKLEEVLGSQKLKRLQNLLPSKEVAEPKPDPSDESQMTPAEEPPEEEEEELKKKKPPRDALCDKELEKLLKRIPVFEAYVLRKRLGLDSKPMTMEQIREELGNKPETVNILYLRGMKRLGELLTPEAIQTLEAKMLRSAKKVTPDEQAQVMALAEIQAIIDSPTTVPALPEATMKEEEQVDQPKATHQESEVVMKEVNFASMNSQELEEALRNVLDGLTPTQAQMLRMRLGLGADGLIQPMTVTEVAKTLGKTKSAIFNAFTPVRRKIRMIHGLEASLILEKRMPDERSKKQKSEGAPVIPLPLPTKEKKQRAAKPKPSATRHGIAKAAAFKKSVKLEKQIGKVIGKLPQRLRRVALMRYDMTLTKIAEELGISYSAAASASSEATIMLKGLLSDAAYQLFRHNLKKSKHGERKAQRQQMEQAQNPEPTPSVEPTLPEASEPKPPPVTEQSAPTETARIVITIEVPMELAKRAVDRGREALEARLDRLEKSFESKRSTLQELAERLRPARSRQPK